MGQKHGANMQGIFDDFEDHILPQMFSYFLNEGEDIRYQYVRVLRAVEM